MRLSVIIPAYNCAGLIPATLESLKAQTLKDFEVLILNDGSTDSTLSVLRAYARTDPRFQIFNLPNGGPSRARNRGIELARGDYLYFMDADDLIHPEMLEALLSRAEREELDVICCGYQMENTASNPPHCKEFRFDAFAAYSAEEFRARLTPLIQAHLMYVVWNKLYRARLIREKGIRFPEEYKSGEDRLFNTAVFPEIQRFRMVDAPYYRYFLRGQSTLANRYIENRFESVLACHDALTQAYQKMVLFDHESQAAISFAFIKGVLSCFTQLHAKGCPLRRKEKRAFIGEILAHPAVQEALGREDPAFGYAKTVNRVLRTGNRTLILLMSKMIFLLQFKLNRLYLSLKHRVKRQPPAKENGS